MGSCFNSCPFSHLSSFAALVSVAMILPSSARLRSTVRATAVRGGRSDARVASSDESYLPLERWFVTCMIPTTLLFGSTNLEMRALEIGRGFGEVGSEEAEAVWLYVTRAGSLEDKL